MSEVEDQTWSKKHISNYHELHDFIFLIKIQFRNIRNQNLIVARSYWPIQHYLHFSKHWTNANSMWFFPYAWWVSHKLLHNKAPQNPVAWSNISIITHVSVVRLRFSCSVLCPAGQLCSVSSWDQQASQGTFFLWQWWRYKTASRNMGDLLWPRHETWHTIPSAYFLLARTGHIPKLNVRGYGMYTLPMMRPWPKDLWMEE